MAKKTKIESITKKALVEAIETEGLNTVVTFVDEKNIVTEPNSIAVTKTAKGNFMVYMTKDNGKMTNVSVHDNRRIANGMVLRRLREVAAN